MKIIVFILLVLGISNECLSQTSRRLIDDSLFVLSNGNLSRDFIKIEYAGSQDHFLPPIYIGNSGECNTGFGKCSYSANYTFHLGFYAYTFLYADTYYKIISNTIENLILTDIKTKYCNDSIYSGYGGFRISIKSTTKTDTVYTCSFQIFDELKKQLKGRKFMGFLWLNDIIDNLENLSKDAIKPDEYNKQR
jgi:hypothetical protein